MTRYFFKQFFIVALLGYGLFLFSVLYSSHKEATLTVKKNEDLLIADLYRQKDKLLLFFALNDSKGFQSEIESLIQRNEDFDICWQDCGSINYFQHPADPKLKVYYKLKKSVFTQKLSKSLLAPINFVLLVLLTCIGWLNQRFINKKIILPIIQLNKTLETVPFNKDNLQKLLSSEIIEWQQVGLQIQRLVDRIKALEVELVSSTTHKVAEQVAHDIRSPLMALKTATSDIKDISPQKRELIEHAISRITNVAGDLLTQFREKSGGKPLAEMVKLLISEKVSIIGDKKAISINLNDRLREPSIKVPLEVQRILSNLINNAVDAIPGNGKVDIELQKNQTHTFIFVADNGEGIPPEKLSQIGKRGFSHGKSDGNGMGVYHAKEKLKEWGGNLLIDSTMGKGTTVTIAIPNQHCTI